MAAGMEGLSGNLIVFVNRYPGNAVLYRVNDDQTMVEVAQCGKEDPTSAEVLQRVWNTNSTAISSPIHMAWLCGGMQRMGSLRI